MTRRQSSPAALACVLIAIAASIPFLAAPTRAAAAPTTSAVPVIIDTDMFTSADDVAAVSTAFALQAQNEADVLAITLNTRTINGQHPVSTETWDCAAALEYFYGSSAPIGTQTPLGNPTPNSPDFAGPCGQLAPASAVPPTAAEAGPGGSQNALTVDEAALNAAANDSVVIICTGYEGNLAALLQADPTLVQQKVAMLVVMGGDYKGTPPSGTAENNFYGDPADASYVAKNWPGPVVYEGETVGESVTSGQTISSAQPAYSPLRAAYEAFVGAGNYYYSYDPIAAYYGIESRYLNDPTAGGIFTPVAGQNSVNPTTGDNTFAVNATGPQDYLSFANSNTPATVGTSLENLLDYVPPPPSGVTAPTNTAPPTISGTPQVGQTLTASTGSWNGGPTHYTYRWLDCAGSSCQPIGGASSQTYQPAARTVGDRLEVEVWASVPGASSSPVISAATAPVSAQPQTPVNEVLPLIQGTSQQGQTLTVRRGTWTDDPTQFTYQWERCPATGAAVGCIPIPGATSVSYKPTADDVGHTLVVLETAGGSGLNPATARSEPTKVVAPPSTVQRSGSPGGRVAPYDTSAPTVSGRAIVGRLLSASTGTWTGTAPLGYAYQWQRLRHRRWSNLSGATRSTYRLRARNEGMRMRVVVTARNAAGEATIPSRSVGPILSVVSAKAERALTRALRVRGRHAQIVWLLRHLDDRFTFRAPAAGRLVVSWRYLPRHGRSMLVATARTTVLRAGRVLVTLRLTHHGARLLGRHHGSVTVIAAGTFRPRHHVAAHVTMPILLGG